MKLTARVLLQGVGPATASAVLAVAQPAYPFMSDEAMAAAVKGPLKYTAPEYVQLVEALQGKAAQLNADGGEHAWPRGCKPLLSAWLHSCANAVRPKASVLIVRAELLLTVVGSVLQATMSGQPATWSAACGPVPRWTGRQSLQKPQPRVEGPSRKHRPNWQYNDQQAPPRSARHDAADKWLLHILHLAIGLDFVTEQQSLFPRRQAQGGCRHLARFYTL